VDRADELSRERGSLILEELEVIRPEKQKLYEQQMQLEEILRDSQQWLGLDDRHFRDALSVSLELMKAQPLEPLDAQEALHDPDRARWQVPALDQMLGSDPAWASVLDMLRPLRKSGQTLWEWRKEAPVRPVVFRDPGSLDGKVVHLHLEHRLVQRLLGRFLSQGFLHDELTRACVCLTDDPVPKVVVLGRLSLYGAKAARLHDEIVAIAAEWLDPEARGRSKLRPLGEEDKKDVLEMLEISLATPRLRDVSPGLLERLKPYSEQDVTELIPHLEKRAETLTERAKKKLEERGRKEAAEMKALLQEQRDRILKQEKQYEQFQLSLFNADELRQLEADRRHWRVRVAELEQEIEAEPARIAETYQVKASRIEPVGLVYLWPVSS
jgi:hypothetical protein